MKRTVRSTSILASLLVAGLGYGQDGASTAGLARTSYLGTVGILPHARDVTVEDFVNYHRHEIARPRAGEAIALETRWSQDKISPNGEAVLQVGLSTALAHDASEMRPLNLSIVIDKSGSMAYDQKLVRVKEALKKLVSSLKPTDTLSIITFDSEASVVFPAAHVDNRAAVDSVIDQIEPGSATNLEEGLKLGYEEAQKHFKQSSTNRVILLTDGIANRGVTDSGAIATESASFNDRGIDLCTIGVGSDVNQDFLRNLAKSGRGLFHFVESGADIQKVFVDDLQSQVSPVGAEPNLTVTYGPGLELEQVYGYETQLRPGVVKIKLDNVNGGMTEAILLRFKTDGRARGDGQLPVSVKLSYFDLDKNKDVTTNREANIPVAGDESVRISRDSSVAKNYCIARVAQAIHDMASDCEKNEFSKGQAVLGSAIRLAKSQYPNEDDADVARTLSIATKYQDVLRKRNGDEQDRDDAPLVAPKSEGPNLVINGDFSMGDSHFTSGLGAGVPATINCLYNNAYTVAASFESPMLHTLVTPGDYSAPDRRTGNEKVMFANAGGVDTMVIWSSVVNMKPHTKYHVSFNAISLSGSNWSNGFEIPTDDWVPSFKITLDGKESNPMKAGCGQYNQIDMIWDSGDTTSATMNIVKVPMVHNGGIIGIANIKMVEVSRSARRNHLPLD